MARGERTYGFVAFTVASAACGLAPSLGALVTLRLVQAVGAAMLQANSVALVTTSAPKARMRFALGVQAGAQAVGLALGPTLGGLLTATAGWRAVYWVNVRVGIAAVVAGRYLLPWTRQFSPPGRFDGPGTALLVTSTSALLLALSAVSGLSLSAWLTALLAVLALAAAAAFIRRASGTRHPLIPVRLLRSRPPAFGLAGAACGYLALFGPLVLIPQVLASGPGGAARTGLLLSALPVGFGLAALLGDLLLPKTWNDRRRGLVSMARGIGTTFGISLMTLAWHLGSHSYQAGNPGYSGSEQARPAFAVLAVVAATAAAIALASRTRPREPAERPGEGSSSGADQ